KKIALFALGCMLISATQAQDTTVVPTKKPVINLAGRANDHLMIQLGYAGWAGAPDSINTGGLSKSFNVYFMFDFPFKTNPKLSMAFGPGISSDHIIFKKTHVGIKDITQTLRLQDQSDTNHFKKTKHNTTYLEAPIELRYTAKPLSSDKSVKFAIVVKVSTMINAHTLNNDFDNAAGVTLDSYTMKETSKR